MRTNPEKVRICPHSFPYISFFISLCMTCSDFISINLILISMRCSVRYKDTTRDLSILINYQQATDTTNGGCILIVVSIDLTHSKFTFHHSLCKVLRQILSTKSSVTQRHIGYISVQALHLRLVSCKGARLDCWIFVFPTILPFQKNFH